MSKHFGAIGPGEQMKFLSHNDELTLQTVSDYIDEINDLLQQVVGTPSIQILTLISTPLTIIKYEQTIYLER